MEWVEVIMNDVEKINLKRLELKKCKRKGV